MAVLLVEIHAIISRKTAKTNKFCGYESSDKNTRFEAAAQGYGGIQPVNLTQKFCKKMALCAKI